MEQIVEHLPIGIEADLVADQPVVVEEAVGGFTKALWEAVAIVLAVSFLSLGLRAGVVVACSIPLVLGMVFAYMMYSGISLQRISLGALIIALGLLVDDAMITIEIMVSQLELGVDREHSATHAWVTTAFPMLTGTLGHGRRLCAHRFRKEWRRRILLFAVRRDRCRSASLMDRRSPVRPGDRRHDIA
jgi:multidrug efflux pump